LAHSVGVLIRGWMGSQLVTNSPASHDQISHLWQQKRRSLLMRSISSI
jgi:hypothetical protein